LLAGEKSQREHGEGGSDAGCTQQNCPFHHSNPLAFASQSLVWWI
jgi:hypothetical protein